MDDKRRIKENIIDFTLLGKEQKRRERLRAFKGPYSDDMALQAARGQAQIDKAYELRSKKLVKRLRDEVLKQLMSVDVKR
ncbi:MAG: hypothetical protein IME98_03445 [Proteobacteria bacterium]|nr:hypothetical protein [Pseudomonadota bacterium]